MYKITTIRHSMDRNKFPDGQDKENLADNKLARNAGKAVLTAVFALVV